LTLFAGFCGAILLVCSNRNCSAAPTGSPGPVAWSRNHKSLEAWIKQQRATAIQAVERSESVDHDLLPLDCQIQRKVADLAIHHERFVIY
jgi:hypothetical protein